jgi:UDP-N-acetylmuramate dehydrogenase
MIEKDKNLKKLNTFMVSVEAKYFASVKNKEEAQKAFHSEEWRLSKKHLILGGGSNILFTKNFDGFVLKNEIKGIEVVEENDKEIFVRAGAGEFWHNFVMWSVERGLWGIENLAYIPGTVGASPVQNIGAYGTEVKSVIQKVEYFDLDDFTEKSIDGENCEFS